MAHQPSSMNKPASGLFIVTTSQEKPNAETRKFIRSHVMRGKNTRKARLIKQLARSAAPTDEVDPPQSSKSLRREGTQTEEKEWHLAPPIKIASELSLFGYEGNMKPYMFELLQQAFTVVKPSTYTVEVVLVDGPKTEMFCFSDFPRNPALLHSLLFTTQAFGDKAVGLPYGNRAQFHLAKSLHHLQLSLANEKEATSNSTMVVVISLATAAAILGDFETVKKHMDGLYRIIELRGGVKTLQPGGLIEHKTERIDFGLALASGEKMRYMPEKISWNPRIAQDVDITNLAELSMIQPRPDPRLLHIWADLKVFTKAANEATKTAVRMPPELFSALTSSVPFRLLSLRFDPESLPELMRLSMLAYMKSILIQIDGLGIQLRALADGLVAALLAQRHSSDMDMARLLLWALFVAALSIFDSFDHDWLRSALVYNASVLGLQTWQETRVILKSFLWIDMVYNKPGKQLFEQWVVQGTI